MPSTLCEPTPALVLHAYPTALREAPAHRLSPPLLARSSSSGRESGTKISMSQRHLGHFLISLNSPILCGNLELAFKLHLFLLSIHPWDIQHSLFSFLQLMWKYAFSAAFSVHHEHPNVAPQLPLIAASAAGPGVLVIKTHLAYYLAWRWPPMQIMSLSLGDGVCPIPPRVIAPRLEMADSRDAAIYSLRETTSTTSLSLQTIEHHTDQRSRRAPTCCCNRDPA